MPTHETVAAWGTALLIDVSLRALVLVALAGLVCYLLRRSSAAARHATWMLTLGALICLPLLRTLMPALPPTAVPLPLVRSGVDSGTWWSAKASRVGRIPAERLALRGKPAPENVPTGTISLSPITPHLHSITAPLPARPVLYSSPVAPLHPMPPGPIAPPLFPLVVTFVWAAGATAVTARAILGLAAARHLVRCCQPVTAGPLVETADEARRALGVLCSVRVLVGSPAATVAVPMTCGFLRPTILLPADAAAWPADRLRTVFLHEMAHVRRGDWLLLALAQCACALYWFHPLVWLAVSRLRNEGEGACDDLVLSSCVSAPDYAAHLLEIVRGLSASRRQWPATVTMARRSDVTDRVRAILGDGRNRLTVTRRGLVVSALFVAGVTVSIAVLRPTAALPPAPPPDQPSVTTPPPAAVMASDASVQGLFSLVDITRETNKGVVTTSPNLLPPHSPALVPIMFGEGGTGLWIRVRGGIGFRTLTAPLDGERHSFPFGQETFVVSGTPRSYTYGWKGPDGTTNASDAEQPYSVWSTGGVTGDPKRAIFTLVPRQLSRQFHVTAQPLSVTGKPLGRSVVLICQPVTPTVLLVQVPTGYDAATRQMQVTAARVGVASTSATWRLADLPRSVPGLKGSLSPAVTAGYGPVVLRAAAAEWDDLGGTQDFVNRHPARPAGGEWFLGQPLNADGHGWTGVPTIRLLLRSRNNSKDFYHQNWMVRLDAMTPQWQTSPVSPVSPFITPCRVFPVYNPQNMLPSAGGWDAHDWQVGVAYPGQQHWIRVDGEMIRFAYRKETITFHDAKVVQDSPSGVNRLVWPTPETETTPSGIAVTVLNRRLAKEDPHAEGATSIGDLRARTSLCSWPGICRRDLCLPGPLLWTHLSRPIRPRKWERLLKARRSPAPDWSALAAPGQADAHSLERGGYVPLCLAVAAAPQPHPSVQADDDGGLVYVPPPSPRRDLKTVTLTIFVREQQEIRPFHLLVPVGASFPPGWDPDAADGRSSAP